jgi:hypothetical protein
MANSTFIPLHPDVIEGAVYREVQTVMTVVLLAAVGVLIAATRGKLGLADEPAAALEREAAYLRPR